MKNRQAEVRRKTLKMLVIKAKIAELYQQRDKVEAELRRLINVGEAVPFGDDQIVVHVNNFAEKTVVFGHGPVRQYEIVVKKAP